MDQLPSDIRFSVKRGSPARLEGRRILEPETFNISQFSCGLIILVAGGP